MATPPIPVEAPAAGRRDPAERIAEWRSELRRERDELRQAFFASPDTARLLRDHAVLVDRVIRQVFAECAMPRDMAAVAVGGYGRGQLYPHSDVDVLVLLPSGVTPPAGAIEHFFATLWDIGIELSHAVRTIEECEVEMAADVTIRTSLLDLADSMIVAPSGKVVARAGGEADELVVHRCDLDAGQSYKRTTFNFAIHRQPDQYRMIVERKGAIDPQSNLP